MLGGLLWNCRSHCPEAWAGHPAPPTEPMGLGAGRDGPCHQGLLPRVWEGRDMAESKDT